MKASIYFLCVFLVISSFTMKANKDVIEVLYDSQQIDYKVGIKLENSKKLQIINKSGGKIYKTELLVSLGQRPCYQVTYLKEDAAKPIPVATFMTAACSDAKAIVLTVNVSTIIYIPIIK